MFCCFFMAGALQASQVNLNNPSYFNLNQPPQAADNIRAMKDYEAQRAIAGVPPQHLRSSGGQKPPNPTRAPKKRYACLNPRRRKGPSIRKKTTLAAAAALQALEETIPFTAEEYAVGAPGVKRQPDDLPSSNLNPIYISDSEEEVQGKPDFRENKIIKR